MKMEYDHFAILGDYDEDGAFNSNNGCGHSENKGSVIGTDHYRYRSLAEKSIGEELTKIRGLSYGVLY